MGSGRAGVPGRVGAGLRRSLAWIRDARRRLRAWRRISFTAGGLVFTLGTFAVGFAAMNTGNNLLYLLLGAMLGLIAVSGWLSEKAIQRLRVRRSIPHGVMVGHEMRIAYDVHNDKRRLPSLAVQISEEGLPGRAFVAHVPPERSASARALNSFVRRGIYPLDTVTLSTAFPFGLFRKERDLHMPGEIVVWPRTDRPVRTPTPGGGRVPRHGFATRGAPGVRGEFRSLREYRPGDEPRDIHWRSSARLSTPVIREYEEDGAETRWVCLDLRGRPGDQAEAAVEVAASLAAASVMESRPFALAAGAVVVEPGQGAGQLERVLDALARVDFSPDGPPPNPPVDPRRCVLVSMAGASGFGDVITVAP